MKKYLILLVCLLFAFHKAYAAPATPLAYTSTTNPLVVIPVTPTSPLPISVYDTGNHSGYCYTSNGSASAATFQSCGGGAGLPATTTSLGSIIVGTGLAITSSGTLSTTTSGSSAIISSLLAATTTNSIDNLNFAQTWNWNTLTTQNALTISTTSATSGGLLVLSEITTGAGKAFSSTLTGASNTGYAGYFVNPATTGYAVYASGAFADTGVTTLGALTTGTLSVNGTGVVSSIAPVSITAATPDIVITPSPGIGSVTVGSTELINAQTTTTPYTVLSTDMGKTVTHSKATAVAVTLPQAGTAGFATGVSYSEINLGAGAVTITPTTSTINGAATLVLAQNQSAYIISDGTNWIAFLGAGITTPVSVANGGTGATSFTTHGVILGEGTSALVATATAASGIPLIAQGGADPIFGTATVAGGGTGLTTGTSGGVLAFTTSTVISSSGALTVNLPVIGGGAGAAPTVGTRTGNTTLFATSTGSLTSGNCLKADANGNIIDNGTTCAGAGGAVALSAITAAVATNSIENGLNAQTWLFDTATSQTAMAITGTGLTTGKLLDIEANVGTNETGYAGYLKNLTTGAGYALYALTTGASNTGYGIYAQNPATTGWAVYASGAFTDTGVTTLGALTTGAVSANGTGILASGTLAVSNGGTGAATFTTHGVMLGEGTSALAVTGTAASGIPLIAQGGADPIFGTAVVGGGGTGDTSLTQYAVLLGNGTSAVTALAPTTTVNWVLTATATAPVWAAAGAGSGTVTSVTFTGDGTVLSSTPSSAVTTSGTLSAALANAAANTILGNNTASSAAPTYTSAPVTVSYGLANTTTGNPAAGFTGLSQKTANTLSISTTGSTALYISTTQSVGIGTTTPGYPLDIQYNSSTLGGINVSNAASGSFINIANFLVPNLSGTQQTNFVFGRSAATNNAGQFAYIYASSGSNNNNVGMTLYGAGGVYAYGNGHVLISTAGTPPSTAAADELDVFGGIGLTTTTATVPTNGIYSPSAGALNITSTGVSAITISSASAVAVPQVTTGTNADFACFASGNVFTLQTSACTISQRKLKEHFVEVTGITAIHDLLALKPMQFNFIPTKPKNADPNADQTQYGFVAEDVASVDQKLAIYENDLKTPKSYRQEAIIALLVKGMQEQQKEIDDLKKQIKK